MEPNLNNCYLRIATKDDKELLIQFLKKYYFFENPFSEALVCLGGGLADKPNVSDSFMDNIDEELSIIALIPENNSIVGFIHNVEVKPSTDTTDYSKDNLSTDKKQLLDLIRHVETQVDFVEKGDREMEVVSITMHPNWTYKELGKLLLEKTINIAKEKNFKQIRAICTSAYSSELFSGCEFQCVYSVKYEDFKKVGRINFLPDLPHTHTKGMILKL
ncbi:hypothetical protein RN001_010129 [Aquatica leii]|uniref:N-acetyltransferase domain-containing protein n=1 Tax=Aquatica leii TaxID=1421715 RepID=A0AAN7QH98_9COLE|nr:hypothetical protein RN001_010129 [Aquatica leii]